MPEKDSQSITCTFTSEQALYLAYMPFLSGGGLFIRTDQSFKLGERLLLSLSLPNDSGYSKLSGKIAWITPQGSQANKPAGVGVQFTSENNRQFCNKIETCLAGMLKSTQTTDTM